MFNYQPINNWPNLPDDFILGNPTGIGIDSFQNIFIFHRANRKWTSIDFMPETFISAKTILMLDRDNGKILNSWGDHLFLMPHGLTVDSNNNIWVTDVLLHQVFKFGYDGQLLMKLGEARVPGDDPTHFAHPTEIAVAGDGSFYVSDGYGNNRVVKFSSSGQYLFEWGRKGVNNGEFNLPHAVDLDREGNVYVADRENNRVQVFTSTGKFIKLWADERFGKISSVAFNKLKKDFIAIDYATSSSDEILGSAIILFDDSGNLIKKFGEDYGLNCWYHNVVIDNQGNIYITDILNNRIQKFKNSTVKR